MLFISIKLSQISREETVKNCLANRCFEISKVLWSSDGLIARLWHAKFEEMRRYRWDNGICQHLRRLNFCW